MTDEPGPFQESSVVVGKCPELVLPISTKDGYANRDLSEGKDRRELGRRRLVKMYR